MKKFFFNSDKVYLVFCFIVCFSCFGIIIINFLGLQFIGYLTGFYPNYILEFAGLVDKSLFELGVVSTTYVVGIFFSFFVLFYFTFTIFYYFKNRKCNSMQNKKED